MTAYRITGQDAIRIATRESLPINCHANPIDAGGIVTPNTAIQIAREDPSLIYIDVTPSGSWRDSTGKFVDSEGRNAHDYFATVGYLGPDQDGIEPGFRLAQQEVSMDGE